MATTTKIYSDTNGTTAASSSSEIRNVQDYSKFNRDLTSTGTSPTFSVDSNGNGSAQFQTDASITQAGSFTGNALVVGQNKSIYFENISDSDLTIGMEGNLTNEKGLNEVGNILSVATTDKDLTSDERRSIVNYFSRKSGSQTEIYDYQAYDVNSKTPTVSLDFTGNGFYRNLPYYFRLGDTYASFADTFMGNSPKLTYGANSNSTMTQGYGPELFEFGSWTGGTGWSVVGETLVGDNATGSFGIPFDTEARVLVVTYTIEDGMSGDVRVRFSGTANNNGIIRSSSGTFTEVMDTTQNSLLQFVDAGAGFTGTISNISVREAPKIVWAAHNLVTYSEDFSQWSDGSISNGSRTNGSLTVSTSEGYAYVSSSITTPTAVTHVIEVDVTCDTTVADVPLRAGLGANNDTALVSFSAGETKRVSFSVIPSSGTLTIGLDARDAVIPGGSNATGYTVTLNKAAVYRSDLGGMAQVPGAATGFEYYVPTNGNAEYLPRVGHHVYNGSAWVNEGLLIESEARSNLVTHSEDFSHSSWFKTNTATLSVDATGPDGQTSAVTLTDSNATGSSIVKVTYSQTVTASTAYTASVYLKADQLSWSAIRIDNLANSFAWFDLTAGTLGTVEAGVTASISDVGNGWYRCSITGTTSGTSHGVEVYVCDADNDTTVDLDGTSSILVYGAQLEAGSTPSSYMPNNGQPGGAPRTAQSLTVPAHWYDADNPTYTGPELVTNGGFSNGTTGWAGSNATLSLSSGRLRVTDNGSSAYAYQVLTVEPGKTYKLTFDYLFPSANTSTDYEVNIRNTNQSGSILKGLNTGTTTWVEDVLSSNSMVFTPNTSTVGLTLTSSSTTGDYADFDNISVRQVSAPQFGWPEPEYIGPELVTDFSTYADQTAFDVDWTRSASSTFSNGNLVLTSAAFAETTSSNIGYTAGTPVVVTFDVTVTPGTVEVWLGGMASYDYQLITTTSSGTFTFTGASTGTDGHLYIRSLAAGTTASVSNISVREINPLSVSIQMDGRMTYADEGVASNVNWWRWIADASNYVEAYYATDGAYDRSKFDQGTIVEQNTSNDSRYLFSPGINVPFNIAARHGSTFVNGAVDGTALPGDTTPTALPDLSGTNLQIASDFMGTIGQFRQFAGDIGDAGLVTATNPSTEPTLSLSFDGTGGSFYNLNWSE